MNVASVFRLGLLLALGVSLRAAEPGLPATVTVGAKLVVQYTNPRFFEGPTWDPHTGRLYFTAFEGTNTQILRLDGPEKVTVWADKTEGINGTWLSNEGRLLGAQAFGHRVTDYGFGDSGPTTPRIILYEPTLNQPNDIVQARNGNLYFTDPDFKARTNSAVYLFTTQNRLVKIITDMPLPNGLKLSPDDSTLYVGDSHQKLWRAYPVKSDGTVGTGRVFFNPDTPNQDDPDGMSMDETGNLYLSGRGGIWVVAPSGKLLGLIPVPEFCANLTFGGAEGRTLYLTCKGKIYSLAMNVRGALFRGKSAAKDEACDCEK